MSLMGEDFLNVIPASTDFVFSESNNKNKKTCRYNSILNDNLREFSVRELNVIMVLICLFQEDKNIVVKTSTLKKMCKMGKSNKQEFSKFFCDLQDKLQKMKFNYNGECMEFNLLNEFVITNKQTFVKLNKDFYFVVDDVFGVKNDTKSKKITTKFSLDEFINIASNKTEKILYCLINSNKKFLVMEEQELYNQLGLKCEKKKAKFKLKKALKNLSFLYPNLRAEFKSNIVKTLIKIQW